MGTNECNFTMMVREIKTQLYPEIKTMYDEIKVRQASIENMYVDIKRMYDELQNTTPTP